jgi:hypothetical protein
MNWIEIDKMLYKMIDRHDTVDAIYAEAQKTFKWDLKQAHDAINPLLKRHTKHIIVAEKPKTRSRKLRNK